jgi:hypothetical protein
VSLMRWPLRTWMGQVQTLPGEASEPGRHVVRTQLCFLVTRRDPRCAWASWNQADCTELQSLSLITLKLSLLSLLCFR